MSGRNTAETSLAALDSIEETRCTVVARVFEFLSKRGDYGATDHEISLRMNLLQSTAGARRFDLVKQGRARKSERRRQTSTGRTAIVWVAVNPPHDPAIDVFDGT